MAKEVGAYSRKSAYIGCTVFALARTLRFKFRLRAILDISSHVENMLYIHIVTFRHLRS